MKALRLVTDPAQRSQMSEAEAIAEKAKATEDMARAKAAFTAAVRAGMDGDPAAERMTKDALSAQQAARKRIADAEETLAVIRDAQGEAELKRKAADLEARWRRTGELCDQKHAKHAARIDALLQELGKEWTDMEEATREISRAVPEVPGLRLGEMKNPASIVNPWHEAMVSGLSQSLCLVTNGALGERKGFQSVQEMRRDGVPKLEELARALHRRILIRQGGKPIAKTLVPEDGEFDGPRAA